VPFRGGGMPLMLHGLGRQRDTGCVSVPATQRVGRSRA
jgi:hypothetical protein